MIMAIPSIAAHRHFLEFVFTPSVPYRLLVMTSTEKHISLCICKGSCRQFTFLAVALAVVPAHHSKNLIETIRISHLPTPNSQTQRTCRDTYISENRRRFSPRWK
jgi:hypothetical protein